MIRSGLGCASTHVGLVSRPSARRGLAGQLIRVDLCCRMLETILPVARRIDRRIHSKAQLGAMVDGLPRRKRSCPTRVRALRSDLDTAPGDRSGRNPTPGSVAIVSSRFHASTLPRETQQRVHPGTGHAESLTFHSRLNPTVVAEFGLAPAQLATEPDWSTSLPGRDRIGLDDDSVRPDERRSFGRYRPG